MHVPDGFLDVQTSIVTGAVACGVVAIALKRSRNELEERTAPLVGLVATFVFAAQMFTFPVGAGTSGHLLGGAMAAVLIGPFTGIICLTVVLIVQALLFADGGITALGTNVVLLAIVTVGTSWLVFRVVQLALPKRPSMVAPAATVAAFVSVPVAALVFVGLYAVGGTAGIPIDRLAIAMVSVHTLIAIGEAAITGAAVSGIMAVRPDLVYGARQLVRNRERITAGASA